MFRQKQPTPQVDDLVCRGPLKVLMILCKRISRLGRHGLMIVSKQYVALFLPLSKTETNVHSIWATDGAKSLVRLETEDLLTI